MPASAFACMADGPESYVSGLIWESRHTVVPEDAMVLEVEFVRSSPDFYMAAIVTVIRGPEDLQGSQIRLIPENSSSCVGFGRRSGFVVVRASGLEVDGHPGMVSYSAVDYLPHASDRSTGFETEKNWFVPGKPAGDLWSPPDE